MGNLTANGVLVLLREAFALKGLPGPSGALSGFTAFDLTEEELIALAGIIEPVTYGPGEVVFREGEASDALYVIKSGCLRVLKALDGSQRHQTLAVLTSPSIVGEMGLLDRSPRSATIQVADEEAAHLLRISWHGFQTLCRSQPSTALKVTYRLAHLLSHRLRTSTEEQIRRGHDRLEGGPHLSMQAPHQRCFDEIVGDGPAIRQVFDLIRKVLHSDITVLIQGETGTGKELIARALHDYGLRRDGPLLAVNCATLHRELLQSELFGHEKGAFTGAEQRRIGRFEQANGGTLFLDEIGDMDPENQAKVLRVLEEQSFERLGGTKAIKTDIRLIAATNRDLLNSNTDIPFRKDLYYRIGVLNILLPPLRDRVEDIKPLSEHFLRRWRPAGSPIQGFHGKTLRVLERYPWPGNVRELENVVLRALWLAEGPLIMPKDLLLEELGGDTGYDPRGADLNLERMEREAIKEALRRAHGVQTQAARYLGVSRRVLHYKISKYHDVLQGLD